MKKYKIMFIIVSLLYIFFLSSCIKKGTPIDNTPKTPSDIGEIDSTYYYDLETHYHMKNGQKTDVAEHTFGRDAVCMRCGFPLFAYAKELNEDTSPYILQIGEEITPVSYHGSQVISFRFVSSNPDVVSTTSTGKIKALKVGSATISAYFQDVLESSINVEVIAKEQISINTNYMDEFTSLLNSFNDEKEFSINFYTLIDGKKEGCEIKYSENPFYYQYNIIGNGVDANNSLHIVQLEDDELFSYTDFENNNAKRTYIEKDNLDDVLGDEKISLSDVTDAITLEKTNITKIDDNHYILKAYLSDMATDSDFLFGDDVGQVKDALDTAIIIFDVVKQDKKLTVKYTINMRVNVGSDIIPYTFDIVFEFNFTKISRYDFSNTSFYSPDKLKDAAFSNLDSLMYITRKNGTFFKYHLEEGTYSFQKTSANLSESTYYEAYDKDLNKIDLHADLKDVDLYKNVLHIENEGDYYFAVYLYDTYNSAHIKLTKCNYVKKDTKEFISDSNQIIGDSNYVKYVYDNQDTNKLLYLTNTGNNTITMYIENSTNSKGDNHIDIKKDEIIFIKPIIGINNYYVYTDDYTAYNYTFSLEEIETGNEELNTNVITSEFNEYYSIGINSNDSITLTLNIESYGLYKFEKLDVRGINDCKVTISPSSSAITKDYINYELKAGQYNVIIKSKQTIDYFKIRYTEIDASDKDVDITLSEITKYGNSSLANRDKEIESIQVVNEKLTNEQIIKYHFTLTEDTNIIYDRIQVEIYNESNDKISIDVPSNSGYGSFIHVLLLKPGKYYVICILKTSFASFTLGTCKDDKNAFAFENTTPIDLRCGTYVDEYVFGYDINYYKYVPDADMRVMFRNKNYGINDNVIVCDENFKKIGEPSWGYNLKAGRTYYIMFYNNSAAPDTREYIFEIG